jgi:hypothetical protein
MGFPVRLATVLSHPIVASSAGELVEEFSPHGPRLVPLPSIPPPDTPGPSPLPPLLVSCQTSHLVRDLGVCRRVLGYSLGSSVVGTWRRVAFSHQVFEAMSTHLTLRSCPSHVQFRLPVFVWQYLVRYMFFFLQARVWNT